LVYILPYELEKEIILWPPQVDWQLVEGGYSEKCGEHAKCIKTHIEWWMPGYGWSMPGRVRWRLKSPIPVSVIPGGNRRISCFRFKALYRAWNAFGVRDYPTIRIYGDDTVLYEFDRVTAGDNKFEDNMFTVDIPIDNYRSLDVEYEHVLGVLTGAYETHYSDFALTFKYIIETPPVMSTVKVYVYDLANGRPIKDATVSLTSGMRLISYGYTGSDGMVTIKNVPGGAGVSYTLNVIKDGYYSHMETLPVEYTDIFVQVGLTAQPKPPSIFGDIWAKYGNYIVIGGMVIVLGGVAKWLLEK